MLRVEDLAVAAGPRTLLEEATLHVRPGDRVGLVGPNGCGKTTLLRCLVGEIAPEHGAIHLRGDADLAFLPQHAVSGSTLTVWEEARSGMRRLLALQGEHEAAQAAVEADEPGALERLDVATERLRHEGGFAADERIGGVLHGLGFSPEAWTRSCDTFSGGWQMRIALARLLLSDANVLLLDEPTNHLDLHARSWLASYLATSDATVILVSHDRHLLDRVCTHTVEIRNRRLHAFKGNLTAWLAERARRDVADEAAAARQQKEIAKLERFVERFGAKATKAAAARSKQKQLDRIERIEVQAPDRRGPRLRLAGAPPSAEEALVLDRATLGWSPDTPILSDVSLTIRRGERWMVLGPNGTGKSTLLQALAGALPPLSGRLRVGRDVRLQTFHQDLRQDLALDDTALEAVRARAPAASDAAIRSALGALGLSGDAAMRRVGDLSGGEKARVVLAGFSLQPANVLLLDEPTNHLDAATVEVLADALSAYEGALLVITHDRWFVERVGTHVLRVQQGAVHTYEGVRPEWLEPGPPPSRAPRADASEGRDDHAARKARRNERRRLERRFAELEAGLERLDGRLGTIDAALFEHASDHEKAAALGVERQEVEAAQEAAFEELATLEEALAEPAD